MSFKLRNHGKINTVEIQNGIVTVWSLDEAVLNPIRVANFPDEDNRSKVFETSGVIGYWPYSSWDGNSDVGDICSKGELLLIDLGEHRYVTIATDAMGGLPFVQHLLLTEPIIAAGYTLISGGDPGRIYAVSEKWIYDLTTPCTKRRNRDFEQRSLLSTSNTYLLFAAYFGTQYHTDGTFDFVKEREFYNPGKLRVPEERK